LKNSLKEKETDNLPFSFSRKRKVQVAQKKKGSWFSPAFSQKAVAQKKKRKKNRKNLKNIKVK